MLAAALALAAELRQRPDEVARLVGGWLADAIARGASAGTLAEALGIDQRADLIRAYRDVQFSKLAASHPELSPRQIADALARYHTDVWSRTRFASDCPHDAGTLESWFWQILRLWPVPLGWRQISRVCHPAVRMAQDIG
jgi:hypothetical protein